MNDEGSVFEAAEASPCTACDTPASEDAPKGAWCNDAQTEKAPARADEAALGIFTNPGADLDTDNEGSAPKAQKSELEQLRGELKQLREELALRDSHMAETARAEREYQEFCELFPNTPLATLTREVWQDVKEGSSLAAAYALAEKKRAVALARATESNESNRFRSAGAVHNAQNQEFSPAEVRAMTSQEVRANLPKIMRSMQKWH